MAQENASFEEIGRVKVSPTTDVVVSTVTKGENITGININTFITSARYTGYTKGTFIPNANIADFAKLINGIL